MILTPKKTLLCALAVVNIVMLLLPFIADIMYNPIDDEYMLLIASGAYTGSPSEYLIFNNICYGWLLKGLYTVMPVIEWYAVVHYVLNMVSLNVFLLLIYKSQIHQVLKIVASLSIALLMFGFMVQPQFTLVAGILGLLSALLVYNADSKKRYILSAVLFLFAVTIRMEAACLSYMVLWLLLVFPIRIKDKAYCRHIAHYCVLVIVLVVTQGIHKYMYNNDEGWRYYSEYNAMRGTICDNYLSCSPHAMELFSGDRQKEYELLSGVRCNDGTILSSDDLKIVVDWLKSNRLSVLRLSIKDYLHEFNRLWIVLFVLLTVAIMALSSTKVHRKRLWLLFSTFMMFMLAILYCASISIPKYRVFIILALSMAVAFIVLAAPVASMKDAKSRIFLIAFMLPLLYCGKKWLTEFNDYRHINEYVLSNTNEVEEIFSTCNADKIFSQTGINIHRNAFHLSKSAIGRKIVHADWMINSPIASQHYSSLESLIDGEGLPMLINSNRRGDDYLRSVQDLLCSYYGRETDVKVLMQGRNHKLVKLIEN